MKQALGTLWKQFVAAGAPARWAVGAILLSALGVGGFSLYESRNPHFEVLVADLDDSTFNRAVSALANAGIRYQTTMPPGPYTIFVETTQRYAALNAIHLEGDFTGPARGIDAEASGAAAVFLGQRERDQRSEKRDWQETELQLEQLVWVNGASVKVSGSAVASFMGARRDDRQASALVNLKGNALPDSTQRRTLAAIVSSSTGVPLERVTVSDQHGNLLFNGGEEQNAESLLAIERAWQNDLERRIQAKLDEAFGRGLTVVGVNGRWKHVQQEMVEETLEPSKKPSSERVLKVEGSTSSSSATPGGPVGVIANTTDSTGGARGTTTGGNSTNESEKTYAFGSTTSHTVAQPHVLEKMSISLLVDASIADQLETAEKAIKGWAAFDLARGDSFEGLAMPLHGLERGEDGKPILPEPEAAPEPANPLVSKGLEHGIEIVAAIGFLVLLLRTLKSAGQAARGGVVTTAKGVTVDPINRTATVKLDANGKPMLSDLINDEEVDLDMLARKHVEELLEKDPERVSALLSRWALGEQFYTSAEKS